MMDGWIPFGGHKKAGYEVFGFFWHILKCLCIKVPVGVQNVVHCFCVVVTHEGRKAAQTEKKEIMKGVNNLEIYSPLVLSLSDMKKGALIPLLFTILIYFDIFLLKHC